MKNNTFVCKRCGFIYDESNHFLTLSCLKDIKDLSEVCVDCRKEIIEIIRKKRSVEYDKEFINNLI